MKLQNILTNYQEDEGKQSLYYECSTSITSAIVTEERKNKSKSLYLQQGAEISFGTYFNSFSIEKWRKYTKTGEYKITLLGSGTVKVTLYHSFLENGEVKVKVLQQTQVELSMERESSIGIPDFVVKGICYPVVEVLSETAVLEQMSYEGQCQGKVRENIFLALDICTFKREPYVKRNMEKLSNCILENHASSLYGKAEVFISDNGRTLGNSLSQFSKVRVIPNENVGGVGGFTRGMLEAIKEEKFTHILIMDDDAVIEPSAIEKTYTFLTVLKKEYWGDTIGGGLLRENTPCIQYESGAVWNRGRIEARKHHLDMSDFKELLKNEQEEKIEYAGWWYSCIPVEQIRTYGLPLPIFIHRDDIEYGLRTGREHFIFMNGIGVWHEAFENKMPGATEYYDWRNLAIVNSIHYTDFTSKELFRFLVKWVTANVIRYRYRYVDMNLRGIEDFLKGVDWLKEQDAQALHKSILAMNYQAVPAEDFIGYRGIKEEDIRWENIEKVTAKNIGKLEKIFRQITMNGYFLPGKRGKVLVAMPHDNIYDMYRYKEILYIDSNGKAVLVKRSLNEAIQCYKRLRRIKKLIDRNFERSRNEYAKRYTELTQEAFWKKYLKMDKGEFHGQGNN